MLVRLALWSSVALLLSPVAHADPPPPGSHDEMIMRNYREWIEGQYNGTGNAARYCCNIADGRPLADDEIRAAGDHYEILFSKAHWDYGDDQWITVPKSAILDRLSPLGYVIAWVGKGGHVFCLALSGSV